MTLPSPSNVLISERFSWRNACKNAQQWCGGHDHHCLEHVVQLLVTVVQIMSQLPLLEALAPPVRFSSAVSGHLGTDEREGPHTQHHAR